MVENQIVVYDEPKWSVYVHITPNNKMYFGITSKIPQIRWGKEGNGYKKNLRFWNAIQKHGWDNIQHNILFTGLTYKEAELWEIQLIAIYNTTDIEYGYNVKKGGLFGSAKKYCLDKNQNSLWKSNMGRPTSDDPKNIKITCRFTEDELLILFECCNILEMDKSSALRYALQIMHKQLVKTNTKVVMY